MYVCMHCLCVCMYVCMHLTMHECGFKYYWFIYMQICMYMHVYTVMWLYKCMYVCNELTWQLHVVWDSVWRARYSYLSRSDFEATGSRKPSRRLRMYYQYKVRSFWRSSRSNSYLLALVELAWPTVVCQLPGCEAKWTHIMQPIGMYVCKYVCMYVSIYLLIHGLYVYIHTCMYLCMYVLMYACK